jgi:predicted ATP-dependent protease
LLSQPFAWEELKRALRSGEVRIEPPEKLLGFASTSTLEPDPIPLRVKVVLLGDRLLYHLLLEYDPDFGQLFKVAADFADRIPRSDGEYARLVATLARRDKLRALDRGAVERVLDEAARRAGDAERFTAELEPVRDLLREADHRAARAGRDRVGEEHVREAVAARERRAGRVRELLLEEIGRGTIVVETAGERVGQVNGLSVLVVAGEPFGRPSRITARVRLGKGEVVDIEREVALGGPIHSKGVLILGGFLGGRYAREAPLTLSASLVFEQSYGGVEGDSASAAELCALLSAVAEVPIRQSVAVTGSVDQHGRVQAVGGVNEKVEGFFEVCRARGLTGEQAVVVPAANAKNLVLRDEVIAAVREGKFRLFAVETVDEAMEILTGLSAGAAGPDGRFPEGTLNARVAERLAALAEKARAFAAAAGGRAGGEGPGNA